MTIRLQGFAFESKRPYLKFINYLVSSNGNIRVNLEDRNTGEKYCHWLNDIEKDKFIHSEVYKTNEPIRGERIKEKDYDF